MKNLIVATVLFVSFSCNDQNNKKDKIGNDSLIVPVNTNVPDTGKINTLKILPRNIPEWKTFWSAFKSAAQNKDTPSVLALINFPFLQNADTVTNVEFMDIFLSQLDGIERATEPIDANGFPLQGRNQVASIDSVRYTNFNHMDYYFGKVNGFYKLVEIITPG
jgi:hypothetical protein